MSVTTGDEASFTSNELTLSTPDDVTVTASYYLVHTSGNIASSSAAANIDNQIPNSDEVWCYCTEPENEVMIRSL